MTLEVRSNQCNSVALPAFMICILRLKYEAKKHFINTPHRPTLCDRRVSSRPISVVIIRFDTDKIGPTFFSSGYYPLGSQ